MPKKNALSSDPKSALWALIDGTGGALEHEVVEQKLKSDAEFRQYFLESMSLHSVLHWNVSELTALADGETLKDGESGNRSDVVLPPRDAEGEQAEAGLRINIKKGRWPNRRMLFFAIASSLLLAFFGIGSLVNRQADQEQAGGRQGAVFAVCRVADSLKWPSDTHPRLKPGDAVPNRDALLWNLVSCRSKRSRAQRSRSRGPVMCHSNPLTEWFVTVVVYWPIYCETMLI